MEEQRKSRLIILGISCLLFAGSAGGYLWYANNKHDIDEDSQVLICKPGHAPPAGVKVPSPENSLSPATKTATTTTPAAITSVGAPQTPAKTSTPSAANDVATTAPAAIAPQPSSATAPQNPTAAPTDRTQPIASTLPAKPQPATPATAAKPVLPATTSATTAKGQPAKGEPDKFSTKTKPGETAVPIAAGKPNGAPLPTALRKPPATKPAVADAAVAKLPEAGASEPTDKTVKIGVPATSESQAAQDARKEVGRTDPMKPSLAFLPFPRLKSGSKPATTNGDDAAVPPPPPVADAPPSPKKSAAVKVTLAAQKGLARTEHSMASKQNLVPPPPPTAESLAEGSDLPISQLPVPPSKPTIGDKLRVLAVMDDKVIISFPHDMISKNRWPKTMTLAKGQEFESIRVVGVGKDGVMIEEDGERTLKPLPSVR